MIGMTSVLQEPRAEVPAVDAGAVAAVERSIEASEALRAELVKGEAAARRVLAELRSGGSIIGSVSGSCASAVEARDDVRRHLDGYLESRRQVRMVLIDACLRSGMTRGQIAGLLGVTRQRVTVLAKDLACGDRSVARSSGDG